MVVREDCHRTQAVCTTFAYDLCEPAQVIGTAKDQGITVNE